MNGMDYIFPELDYLIQNIFTYAEIVRLAGNRNNINLNMLKNLGIESKRAEIILEAVQRSKGGDILEENLSIIKKLANEVIMQTELRRILAQSNSREHGKNCSKYQGIINSHSWSTIDG